MRINSVVANVSISCPTNSLMPYTERPGLPKRQRRSHCAGYVFAPGALFSQGGTFGNCLRINAGRPMTPEIEQGLRVIGELAHMVQADTLQTA